VKTVKLLTPTKTAPHWLCWCSFSQKMFSFWQSEPIYTTRNAWTRKRPSRRTPDITLLDMMTFIGLALQI
jgi:hypothetical protein